MVETAEEASRLVAAVNYPPKGVRGVGSSLARASRFNRVPDYLRTASEQICLLLQIETQKGLGNIDAIAATPGVDGIFIGPSDLAADLGHLGEPGHLDIQEKVRHGISRILARGKAPGVLTTDLQLARTYLDEGALYVAVGTDVGLLVQATQKLADAFRPPAATEIP